MTTAQPKLQILNRFLSLIVFVLATYIILLPLLPELTWWVNHHTPIKPTVVTNLPEPSSDNQSSRPTVNTLIIPRLNFKKEIFDGMYANTLSKGLWHMPGFGSPSTGGNTIIPGHRFTYSGPAIFYNLDKVKVGDTMTIYWQKQRYDYVVSKIRVVSPHDPTVQVNTAEAKLTLITCTPLWTAHDRLIVEAQLTRHTQ